MWRIFLSVVVVCVMIIAFEANTVWAEGEVGQIREKQNKLIAADKERRQEWRKNLSEFDGKVVKREKLRARTNKGTCQKTDYKAN